MLNAIRRKIAQSISNIEPPPLLSIQDFLKTPKTEVKPVDLDLPYHQSMPFDVPHGLSSDNICLQISKAIDETTVLIKEVGTSISLLIKVSGKEVQSETLAEPRTKQLHVPLMSEASSDLLPVTPSVDRIDPILINLPKVQKPVSGFLFSETAIECYSQHLLFDTSQTSVNLLEPFRRPRTDGKDYGRLSPKQESLFPEVPLSDEHSVPRVRKAYSLKETPYSTQEVIRLNIWDLIFPLLLPPLTLEFTEQFDLYQPLFGFQQKGVEFLITHTSALLQTKWAQEKLSKQWLHFAYFSAKPR